MAVETEIWSNSTDAEIWNLQTIIVTVTHGRGQRILKYFVFPTAACLIKLVMIEPSHEQEQKKT